MARGMGARGGQFLQSYKKQQEQTQNGIKLTVTSEQARGELFLDETIANCGSCFMPAMLSTVVFSLLFPLNIL